MRPTVVGAALITGFLSVFAAFGQLLHQRSQLNRLTAPPSSILDQYRSPDSTSPATYVLFLFRPADCPTSLDRIDRLNAEARLGKIRVEGIMISDVSDTSFVPDLMASYRIQFPVRLHRSKEVADYLHRFGITELPASLVFDQTGSVRAIGSSSRSDSLLNRAIDAVIR